jgi:hypothetical protein
MKFLRQALATIAALTAMTGLAPAARAAEQAALADSPVLYAPPAQPSMYSFADVFRLTVAGAPMTNNPLTRLPTSAALADYPDYQLRVASSEPREPVRQLFSIASPAPLPASYVFSIGAMPQPELWLLVLSGFAAAAWVARRRLGYSF